MKHLDSMGNPLVYVQRVDSRGETTWEVVDRRLPTGLRIAATFTAEEAARSAAEALDRRG